MAARAALILLTALRLTESVRLSGDETNPKGRDVADALEKFFKNESAYPAKREALADVASSDGDGKDEDSMKFKYLGTKCLKGRARFAAREFAKAGGCKKLLEVGGYLAPFPDASKGEKDDWAKDLELYVNVDPSSKKTERDPVSSDYASVTLKVVTEEFVNASLVKKITEKSPFDCFLMLGVYEPQVGTAAKKKALKKLVSKAKIAILESPQSDPNGPKLTKPVLTEAGFSSSVETTVDCTDDDESKKLAKASGVPDSALKRDVVVYKKSESKAGKKF